VLCAKYERGLKYLINRICPAYATECFRATMEEAADAIHTGCVLTEDDWPVFLRKTARRLAGTFPPASLVNKVSAVHPDVISAIQQKLTIFTAVQLEALVLYYVREEAPASICAALALDIDQFNLIRKAARGVYGLRFSELIQHGPSPSSGQKGMTVSLGATVVVKVKWGTRVVAGTTS